MGPGRDASRWASDVAGGGKRQGIWNEPTMSISFLDVARLAVPSIDFVPLPSSLGRVATLTRLRLTHLSLQDLERGLSLYPLLPNLPRLTGLSITLGPLPLIEANLSLSQSHHQPVEIPELIEPELQSMDISLGGYLPSYERARDHLPRSKSSTSSAGTTSLPPPSDEPPPPHRQHGSPHSTASCPPTRVRPHLVQHLPQYMLPPHPPLRLRLLESYLYSITEAAAVRDLEGEDAVLCPELVSLADPGCLVERSSVVAFVASRMDDDSTIRTLKQCRTDARTQRPGAG